MPSLFNKPKGWSMSASNTEANSAAFIMRWEDHFNFAIPEKIYSYSRAITKNLQNLKNFQSPLHVKNDTFLNTATEKKQQCDT